MTAEIWRLRRPARWCTVSGTSFWTIWPATTVPGFPDAGPDSSVELGVMFRADTNGYIAGVRFYKASTNTGTHTGSLWTTTGQLLATATFTNESVSGWQTVMFSTPVAVTANTTYVASYHTSVGHYSGDSAYFAGNGIDNAPLHALGTTANTSNGVFGYGASTVFPTTSYGATNYWVDVVYTTNGPPPPALTSILVSPAAQTILTGSTEQFTATGTYADGSSKDISLQVTWGSSNTAVATVNTSGLVSAVAPGNTTISATLNSVSSSTALTVIAVAGSVSSIWPSSTVPSTVDGGADNPVELGVKFRSDSSGYITGARFYKASSNTGAHVANLWSSTGTLLATAPFAGESASGWQQVTFPTSVPITANTVYIVSYHTNVGHYSFSSGYFSGQGFDNAQLHALADGASGPNGVYAYGSASVFPSNGYNASNYWVDVVFNSTPPPPPALTIATAALPSGTVNAAYSATVAGSGGTSPYTWALSAGSLPGGLSLNATTGVISGTPTATGTFSFTVRISDAGTPQQTASKVLSITVSTTASVTIWPVSAVPAIIDAGADSPVELGVKFRSDVSGHITGVRFYKSAANTGTHTGSLWSSTGALLASATFTG